MFLLCVFFLRSRTSGSNMRAYSSGCQGQNGESNTTIIAKESAIRLLNDQIRQADDVIEKLTEKRKSLQTLDYSPQRDGMLRTVGIQIGAQKRDKQIYERTIERNTSEIDSLKKRLR